MSERKIDFGRGEDWAAHRQSHWLDFAGNPNFPDYLRVVFVAYAGHRANGHAILERGALAAFLVRKNGTMPNRKALWDAIQKAIRLGYLLPESRVLCLVVSSDHAQIGVGDPDEPCPRDHTKRAANVLSDAGRFATNVRDETGPSIPNVRSHTGRSAAKVRHQYGRSTLSPSLSSVSQPTDEREATA